MKNDYSTERMHPAIKWSIIGVVSLLVIIIAIYMWTRHQMSSMQDPSKPLEEPALLSTKNLKDNESVLLLGTDNPSDGDEKNVRTDTIMIATYNADKNSIKLLRLPRDIYVHTDQYEGRINGLYEKEGVKGLVKYINDTYHVPISDYAMVDFNGLEHVVDTIGGIDVDSDIKIDKSNNKNLDKDIRVDKGHQHLDGEEALGYARIRYIDNDIKRGDRQTEVIKAIGDKLLSKEAIPKLPKVVMTLKNYVTTSMDADKIESNAKNLSSHPDIENVKFEWKDTKKGDTSYVEIPDKEEKRLSDELRKHLHIENTDVKSDDDNLMH